MNKALYLLSFGLAMGLMAAGQTSSQTQTPPVNPTTPANQIGSGAQTKTGTPATSSTAPNGQVNPTGTAEPPAQSASPNSSTTGGIAGAVGASAGQMPAAEGSPNGIAVADPDLEAQIQNALNKEPTLTSDNTRVKVSADTIELDGNVATNKEKVTATRIVQSYAGSKKLVNHLTIGGVGNGKTTSPRTEPQDSSDRTRPAGANPAENPEPNKGTKPPKM